MSINLGSNPRRSGILVNVVIASALFALSPSLVSADPAPLTIIQPADAAAQTGNTYGQWSAIWWQTMLALPNDQSPLLDTTGKMCLNGDSSEMFFLGGDAGGAVERKCTVPASKPLFFPIINTECSNIEAPPFFGRTDKQLINCAKTIEDGVDITTLVATLDGVSVPNLAAYRAASPVYSFTVPANNFLGVTGPSAGRSAADGYYLLLAQPSPGSHTIHFEGADASGFSLSVTYHLAVKCSDQTGACDIQVGHP